MGPGGAAGRGNLLVWDHLVIRSSSRERGLFVGAVIIGSGKALPQLEIANDELKAVVDTNDEWIRTRTGISTLKKKEKRRCVRREFIN